MEFTVESMRKLKDTVEKCIAELSKKDDLTPQETKALLDGFQVRHWICEELEDCKMAEEYSDRRGDMGYSGRRMYSRSYGMPRYDVRGYYPSYSGYPGYPTEHMAASYCGPMDPYYYGDRGNSMGYMNHSDRSVSGYSRHSIGDKAVERLENLMDQAGSDYEKEQLHKFIRMIRAAAEEG